jgi:hypothetical protein
MRPALMSEDLYDRIRMRFVAGMSAHQVAKLHQIPYETALQIQVSVTEQTKRELVNQRIMLRNAAREAVPEAIQTLREATSGVRVTVEGKTEAVYAKKEDLAIMRERVNAASKLLAFAKDAVNENILSWLSEKESGQDFSQEELFSFEMQFQDDGATHVVPKKIPLKIVGGDL